MSDNELIHACAGILILRVDLATSNAARVAHIDRLIALFPPEIRRQAVRQARGIYHLAGRERGMPVNVALFILDMVKC